MLPTALILYKIAGTRRLSRSSNQDTVVGTTLTSIPSDEVFRAMRSIRVSSGVVSALGSAVAISRGLRRQEKRHAT